MKRFRPHRFTLNAFDDGSGVWLCEWRDNNSYREHCWDPKGGYSVYKNHSGREWFGTDISYVGTSAAKVDRRIALGILKVWKSGNSWNRKGGSK